MRTTRVLLIATSAFIALAAPSSLPARAGDQPPDEVFFRHPDKATAARLEKLMLQLTEDGLQVRRDARRELEDLSYWSVDPLVSSLVRADPPARCAAALVLDAIGDPRSVAPLRSAVVRESSHPQVGAFCALALGRFRDAGAVVPFRQAVGDRSGPEALRIAVPLALARIRGGEALSLLTGLLGETDEKEPVVSSRLLALGFFPEAALVPGTPQPSPILERGLKSPRVLERHAAVTAYIVATARRRDGKELLMRILASDEDRVVGATLPGLAQYGDPDVTEALAKTAESRRPDVIREIACDLLVSRGDPTALPTLLRLLKGSNSARLRASAVLALASIDDSDASGNVVRRISDRMPLVRAAATVGATRLVSATAKTEALGEIESRLRAGETDKAVKEVMLLARSVLLGQRRDVVWPEVGAETLFRDTGLTPERRVLLAVNARVELCLDLARIQFQEGDASFGPDAIDPNAGGGPLSPGTGSSPLDPPDPTGLQSGQPRPPAHEELRDLKLELRRRPYFTADDLPVPGGAKTE